MQPQHRLPKGFEVNHAKRGDCHQDEESQHDHPSPIVHLPVRAKQKVDSRPVSDQIFECRQLLYLFLENGIPPRQLILSKDELQKISDLLELVLRKDELQKI